MTAKQPVVKLRRTIWSVVMTAPLAFLPLFVAALLLASVVTEGDGVALLFAFFCISFWSVGFWRVVRLRRGCLAHHSPPLRATAFPLNEISLVEVVKIQRPGFPGYSGYALAIETAARRFVLPASLYNGRSRLADWSHTIAKSDGFQGRVRVDGSEIPSPGRPSADRDSG